MPSYISSNDNRFYVGTESAYGQIPAVAATNRIPSVKLKARQAFESTVRHDKTGGRTFLGLPAGTRKKTSFELSTYLTSWDGLTSEPSYGPMIRAAMGNTVLSFAGASLDSAVSPTRLQFPAAHGLVAGQAVSFGGEIRFISAVPSNVQIDIHAPFSILPTSGAPIGPTVTYKLAKQLPSASIFDYWDPADAVQRVISGAAVNKFTAKINGDFHEFGFSGPACDVVDSSSYSSGQGGLSQFPIEPAVLAYNYSIVPGHLGQVWLGSSPQQFFTLTGGQMILDNGIDLRNNEFGTDTPRSFSAGRRKVALDLTLFQQDDTATRGLYQAARQRSPITAMMQLGQQPGQLFGIFMKSVVPEVPEYDDAETRLQWKFTENRAQGTADDELVVAFG
jgi:hypothetical protein